jgi:hypothetical protein|nr:MAG TPA: hypothetical protein [Caudoviricetes sp.]
MKYYVLRPDLTPYEGMIVNKDSKLKFKNEKVEQKLENLKLTTKQKVVTDKYTTKSELTINLDEGEILLFENENRGWFLPAQSIGTIETAINDYKTLAEVLDGDKGDTRGNEN